jgi:hypothetical protein
LKEIEVNQLLRMLGSNRHVKFEIFGAANIRTAVFWVMTPCSVMRDYRGFV